MRFADARGWKNWLKKFEELEERQGTHLCCYYRFSDRKAGIDVKGSRT